VGFGVPLAWGEASWAGAEGPVQILAFAGKIVGVGVGLALGAAAFTTM
jgi:hypothetical protein